MPAGLGPPRPVYDVDEIIGYARALDRLEMHVYDGGHLLLETHAPECATAMRAFVADIATEHQPPVTA